KRKRPPTFQHFPAERARKLKQGWVQNAKLKSKWKAEKRRLAATQAVPVEESEGAHGDDIEVEGNQLETTTERPPTPPHPPKKRPRHSQPNSVEAESSNAPTLRDRARDAYSRASLHTYKSDPLGKRQRGGKPGATGRGQPDMKKRMNVLIEQIKERIA
ncbi:hypothetical protein GGX14DRAFT_590271, partial [Mycena pura]